MKSYLDPRKKRLHVLIEEEILSTRVDEMKADFQACIDSENLADWEFLYLDIRDCRMIDSMGMNWLFAESVRLKQEEKTFVVRISSPAIHRVMTFTGFDKRVVLKYRRRKQYR